MGIDVSGVIIEYVNGRGNWPSLWRLCKRCSGAHRGGSTKVCLQFTESCVFTEQVLAKKYKVSRMSSTPYMRHIEYDYIVQTVRFHFWPPLGHFGEFLYCSYLNSNSCVEKAPLVRFNQPNPATHDIRPPQILAQDFLERDHRLHLQPL